MITPERLSELRELPGAADENDVRFLVAEIDRLDLQLQIERTQREVLKAASSAEQAARDDMRFALDTLSNVLLHVTRSPRASEQG